MFVGQDASAVLLGKGGLHRSTTYKGANNSSACQQHVLSGLIYCSFNSLHHCDP